MLELDIEVPRRSFSVALSLRVDAGERFALFGPSGAGKTTVLEAVAGLVAPLRGSITLGGRVLWARTGTPSERAPMTSTGAGAAASTGAGATAGTGPRIRSREVPSWDRAVALLRQEPALFPHLSVQENLTYSRRSSGLGELSRLVSLLDLDGLLGARPSTLSGGQAQRVALARALASDCRALLLDEPYTGLDATLRRQATAVVRDEIERRGLPAVLVTHELAEAQAFADTLGVIDEGRLLQVGSPHEVVLRPASRRIAELVGYRGFVDVGGLAAGVHPERVRLGAQPEKGPVLSGRVLRVRPAGAGFEADLRVRSVDITCRLEPQEEAPGSNIEITLVDPPLFAPDGKAAASHHVATA